MRRAPASVAFAENRFAVNNRDARVIRRRVYAKNEWMIYAQVSTREIRRERLKRSVSSLAGKEFDSALYAARL